MDTTASLLVITMFVLMVAVAVYAAIGVRVLIREVAKLQDMVTGKQRYNAPVFTPRETPDAATAPSSP